MSEFLLVNRSSLVMFLTCTRAPCRPSSSRCYVVVNVRVPPGEPILPGDVPYMHPGSLETLPGGSIAHHALDSSVHGPHELHQGGLVVQPLPLQALPWWVLVTTELKGDLEVIGAEVVEVLHPATDRVP